MIVPILVSGTFKHREAKKSFLTRMFDLMTAITHPIQLYYKLVVAKCLRERLLVRNCSTLEQKFIENSKTIGKIEESISRHIRLQQGLETIYQLATSTILLLYAHSKTRTSEGLTGLFDGARISFFGLSISPTFMITLNVLLNIFSFTRANITSTRGNGAYFPLLSKLVLGISILCSCAARIIGMTLYFAPVLGLFDLLFHFKGMYVPYT